MPLPKAYQPEEGYKYQILTRNISYNRSWEHCDYAVDRADLNHLLGNYGLSYRGFEFKTITLPRKYWPGKVSCFSPKSRSGVNTIMSVNLGIII